MAWVQGLHFQNSILNLAEWYNLIVFTLGFFFFLTIHGIGHPVIRITGDSNENAKIIVPWAFSFPLSIDKAQAESLEHFFLIVWQALVCSSVSGFRFVNRLSIFGVCNGKSKWKQRPHMLRPEGRGCSPKGFRDSEQWFALSWDTAYPAGTSTRNWPTSLQKSPDQDQHDGDPFMLRCL